MKKHTIKELEQAIKLLNKEKQTLEELQTLMNQKLKTCQTEYSINAIHHALEELKYSLTAICFELKKIQTELDKLENVEQSI